MARSAKPVSGTVFFSSDDESVPTVPYDDSGNEENQVDAYTKYMVAEVGRSQGSFKGAVVRKQSQNRQSNKS